MNDPSDGLDDAFDENPDKDFNNRSAVIFLIDFRKPMFKKSEDGGYYFKRCIECCKSVMIGLARKEHRNWATGIILMGAEKSGRDTLPKRVAELQSLNSVSVERIVKLSDMIIENFATAIRKYGQSDSILISTGLHYCQVAFKKWRKDIHNKTIIIFTYDDDPHADDIKEAHKARKQAEDLRLWNIGLDVVPFGNFDKSKFYKELIMTVKDDEFDDWATTEEKNSTVEDIMNIVQTIVGKFYCQHRYLYLGDSREIAVDILKPFIEPSPLLKKYNASDDEDDEIDISVRGIQNPSEGPGPSTDPPTLNIKQISPSILKAKKLHPLIGCRVLKINKYEMMTKGTKPKVGFTLVGFYPSADIPEHYTTAAPYLMVPNVTDRENASLFTYLWKRCMERELSIICWYAYHKSASPALASLTATEELTLATDKTSPPGFIVTILPFSDEINELDDLSEECNKWTPSESQKAAAEAIVKKLSFKYAPDKFHDYQHRKNLAMVEALALHYDDVDEIEDDTDIDLENISERLGSLSAEFMNCSHLPATDEPLKRKSDDKSANVSRQPKSRKGESNNENVLKMIRERMAHKLTVAELRAILQTEGVKSLSTYTKPKLVELAYLRFNKDSQD